VRLPLVTRGVSKRVLQWYSKYYCVASVRKLLHLKTYKLSIVQGVERKFSKLVMFESIGEEGTETTGS
jgi:hypothetical protein